MIITFMKKTGGVWAVSGQFANVTSASWSETAQDKWGDTATKVQFITNENGVQNVTLGEDEAFSMESISEKLDEDEEMFVEIEAVEDGTSPTAA